MVLRSPPVVRRSSAFCVLQTRGGDSPPDAGAQGGRAEGGHEAAPQPHHPPARAQTGHGAGQKQTLDSCHEKNDPKMKFLNDCELITI